MSLRFGASVVTRCRGTEGRGGDTCPLPALTAVLSSLFPSSRGPHDSSRETRDSGTKDLRGKWSLMDCSSMPRMVSTMVGRAGDVVKSRALRKGCAVRATHP